MRASSVTSDMPLLLLLFALFIPRVVIVLLWLFTGWFAGLFGNVLLPILGFLFLPYTLLWYSVVLRWYGGSWDGFTIVVLVLAVVADLWSWGGVRR
jgi:hypothetical protein